MANLVYLDSKLCDTIKRLVADKPAYYVGGYSSMDDVKLAVKTGYCFAGSNLMKKFDFDDVNFIKCELSRLDIVPMLPAVYDMNENTNVIQIIAEMIESDVASKPLRFSIPKHPGALGMAILNTGESQEVNRCHISFKSRTYGNKIIGKSRTISPHKLGGVCNPKAGMHNAILKSLNFCFYSVDEKYSRKPRTFFDMMVRSRGMIERLPSVNCMAIDAVGFISPDGSIHLKRVFESLQTMAGSRYAYMYPQTDIPTAKIEDLFYKVASVIAGRQGYGWITVGVDAFDSDNRSEERSITQTCAKTRLNVKALVRPYILGVRSVEMHYNHACSYSDLIDLMPRNRSIVIVPFLRMTGNQPTKAQSDINSKAADPIDINTRLSMLMAKGIYFDIKSMQGSLLVDDSVISAAVSRSAAIRQAINMIKDSHIKACRHPYQSFIDKASIIDFLDSAHRQSTANND